MDSWTIVIIIISCVLIPIFFVIPLLSAILVLVRGRYKKNKSYDDPSTEGFEKVEFRAKSCCCGVSIKAWWKPPEKESNGIIILVHGHSSSFTRISKTYGGSYYGLYGVHFAQAGFGVLGLDIRNHGDSGYSPPFAMGNREKWDIKAAMDFVSKKFPEEKIGIFASSLGTSHAILAAALPDINVDAMMIDCPPNAYDSDLVQLWLSRFAVIPKWYISFHLLFLKVIYVLMTCSFWVDSINVVHLVKCPVFHLHGNQDRVVPYKGNEQLQNAFRKRLVPFYKFLAYDGAHIAAHKCIERFSELMTGFFKVALRNPGSVSNDNFSNFFDNF